MERSVVEENDVSAEPVVETHVESVQLLTDGIGTVTTDDDSKEACRDLLESFVTNWFCQTNTLDELIDKVGVMRQIYLTKQVSSRSNAYTPRLISFYF